MRMALLLLLPLLAVAPAHADRVEVVWEQRFDAPALPEGVWRLDGSAMADGALRTGGVADGPAFSGAHGVSTEAIPGADAGHVLRLEWEFIPVRTGRGGQEIRVDDGPVHPEAPGRLFTFRLDGDRPLLYRQWYTHHARHPHPARDTVAAGRPVRFACDFNRHTIFSWTIDGQEQLSAPLPLQRTIARHVRLLLGDARAAGTETRWLSMRLSRVFPNDPLPARVSGWRVIGEPEPDQPSAFMVGHATAMEKVFREAAAFRGSFGRQVSIAAAGRERESFQLVLVPLLGQPLRRVTVELTDLLHADGRSRLSRERISWNRVGYVQTQPTMSSLERVGWWWPDVLLLPEPFDVPAGFVQPVWFTVDVPADTPAGVYRGLVTLRPEGVPAQTVGVELTVRAFNLPLRGTLKTAFSMSPGTWEIWHNPTEVRRRLNLADDHGIGPLEGPYDSEGVLPPGKWREMYDFLLAHRLSPSFIYNHFRNGRTRVLPSREDIQYVYERGANTICLAAVDVWSEDPEVQERYLAHLEAWLAEWYPLIEEKNWPDFTWFVHGFDESDWRAPAARRMATSAIKRYFGRIGERFPRIKRESANPFNPEHVGYFDIWTPATQAWTPELRERQAAGDQVWAYVCVGPLKPFANLLLDYPRTDARVLLWTFYQHGVTGMLHWMTNNFLLQENWNKDGPKWPERPWNARCGGNTNGDGLLIYPGPNATPLASTRLVNVRDGIEDYEALAILAGLADRLQAAGGHADMLAQARQVLAIRPEVSRSWTDYTEDPQVLKRARAEVDGLIEAAMRALGSAGPAR